MSTVPGRSVPLREAAIQNVDVMCRLAARPARIALRLGQNPWGQGVTLRRVPWQPFYRSHMRLRGGVSPHVSLACTSTGAILFYAPGLAVTAPVGPAPVTRWLPRDGRPPARHLFSSRTEFQTRPFRDIRPPHQARSARDALSEKVRTGYGRSEGAGISFLWPICDLHVTSS